MNCTCRFKLFGIPSCCVYWQWLDKTMSSEDCLGMKNQPWASRRSNLHCLSFKFWHDRSIPAVANLKITHRSFMIDERIWDTMSACNGPSHKVPETPKAPGHITLPIQENATRASVLTWGPQLYEIEVKLIHKVKCKDNCRVGFRKLYYKCRSSIHFQATLSSILWWPATTPDWARRHNVSNSDRSMRRESDAEKLARKSLIG